MASVVRTHPGARSTSAEERALEIREAKDEKLSPFRDYDGGPLKLSKAQRAELIDLQFPSVKNLDWGAAFNNDIDLFGRILRDIIKLEQREPGKSGPRPNNLDYDKGLATFRQLMGEDFSTLPFMEAFQLLVRDCSRTQVARKTHLSRTKVHRLLSGEYDPTSDDMRAIADGFNKHPSFFVEYRRSFIVEQLTNTLLDEPERTIAYYQKMLNVQ